MKTWIVLPVIVLLFQGCDKPEEKQSSINTAPKPKPAERLKPVGSGTKPDSPAQPGENPDPAAPAVPAPSAAEIAAFHADVEAFAKKAEPFLQSAGTENAVDGTPLQEECRSLMERRSKLLAGLPAEQKQELARKSLAVMRVNLLLRSQQMGKVKPYRQPAQTAEELIRENQPETPPPVSDAAPDPK
ncbi:MAG TPA: hypothetical protein VG796_13355 [Verrucomicrobiales bacterium]|nr:hypothetical protein [Verrucomicrobiales bacterium]